MEKYKNVLNCNFFCSGLAKARVMAYFGEGEGPIHTDNVKCTGGEHSLIDCIKQPFGTHNCRHSEDAGVICNYGLQKDSPEVKGEVLHLLIATAFTYYYFNNITLLV